MSKGIRNIIRIDESKCDGCGQCAEACAEGAIRIVDGVAKLVSETYCDGLGACLGECPQGAITIEQRPAEGYDEAATREHLATIGREPKPHAPGHDHADSHAHAHAVAHSGGCPGSRMRILQPRAAAAEDPGGRVASRLAQWPVQLTLVPPSAPYLRDADVLIAADCVPFAYPEFHRDFLDGKALLVGCPKLDDLEFYTTKLTQIFRNASPRSVTVLRMEVPCCGGIVHAVVEALRAAGRAVPVKTVTIGIAGEVLDTEILEPPADRAAMPAPGANP